jgi:hypothetical protein
VIAHRERRLVDGVVPALVGQAGVGLDDDAQELEAMVGIHLGERARHVEIGLDEVTARVVPVDARDLDDAHAGQPVRLPLATVAMSRPQMPG